jgi:hypothetical protein
MKTLLFTILTIATMMIAGCSKSGDPSPSAQPQVASMLTGRSRSVQVSTVSKDSLVVTSAVANSNRVKFEAKRSGTEIEYRSGEQRTIDLFSTDPVAGIFKIPAGSYDEVEIRTLIVPLNGQPSFELKANLTLNGTVVPLTFRTSASIEIKGEKKNVVIDSTSGYSISTLMDFTRVFAGVSASDLSNAARVNGGILIDLDNNTAIYKKLIQNLSDLDDECEVHRH